MSIRSYVRSTDNHRKPCGEYIFPSIDIPIDALCSTTGTIPATDIKRQLIHHETTMVTPFTTGEESVNLDQFSPVPFTFIFKLTKHLTPSSIANTTSQLVVLDHVSNCQVLNSNQAIFLNQVRRQLVQKISTSIFNFGVYSGYFKSRFMSVTRAFGFPTQFLLRYFQLLIQPIEMLGIGYLFSITGTKETRTRISHKYLDRG